MASTAARTGGRTSASPSRARRLRIVLAALVVTLAAGTLVVHHQLFGDVIRLEGAFSGLDERPALAAAGAALNILLLGVRRSGTPSDGSPSRVRWLPDATLESAMVVHVTADRRSAAAVAIPLDTRVEAAGGRTVEAAVTSTGPSDAVEAVETVSDVRMDHLAVVDWAALEALAARSDSDLATAPTAADASALARRQLLFLQDLAHAALHAEMRKQPWAVYQLLDTLTEGLALDEEWSALELALTALSLRNLRSADIAFFVADSADRDAWTALEEDGVQAWLAQHPRRLEVAPS